MCGIVGYMPGVREIDHQTVIGEMCDAMVHRGPDSDGTFISDKMVLGFRRLSIIDLRDEADQPLFNKDKSLALIFNGEIYNYKALRSELVDLGYEFISETDSEVLVHGYDAWGDGVLQKVRGMFAFAIWDARKEELFLARDFFGIKPLYYGAPSDDGTFFFGSEIKCFLKHPAFQKEVNAKALRPYLTFQYPATEETFFKGIYKLTPGTWMKVKDGSVIARGRYWDFNYRAADLSDDEAVSAIGETLRESVRAHQMADVKVGAFLSGGIDSSFITALFRPEETFSVGFKDYDGVFNETNLGARLSELLGFTHHKRLIDADDFFGALPVIQYHMDEPQSNLSSVPLYFLAQLASEHVKVVLSGEGADELFGGYDSYMDTPHLALYKRLPAFVRRGLYQTVGKSFPHSRLGDLAVRGGQPLRESFVGQAKIFPDDEALALLKPAYRSGPSAVELLAPYYDSLSGRDELTCKQVIDIRTWLPGDILLKADKMSSAHSLELRVPFLDKEVMRLASRLKPDQRVKDGVAKISLRKAALAELPEEWAKRPKVGFPVPLRDWLHQEKYYLAVKEIFSRPYVSTFFDQEKLLGYLQEHYEGKALRQRYIYTVLCFLIWYDEYFVKR